MAISCENCSGVCCSNMQIRLRVEEANLLTSHGTKLNLITEIKSVPRMNEDTGKVEAMPVEDLAYYSMEGDCGCLLPKDENGMRKCDIYNKMKRPEACEEFEPGEAICLFNRIVADAIKNGYRFTPLDVAGNGEV